MNKPAFFVAIILTSISFSYTKANGQSGYYCVGYNIPCLGPGDICNFCDNNADFPQCTFNEDCDFPWPCISTLCEQRLAVELSFFGVQVIGEIVKLNWSTASETDNAGFAVEYSLDANFYYEAGWVNPNLEREYEYSYKARSSGIQHIRLKAVDLNGVHEYSEVLTIQVGIPEGLHYLKVAYPNPFSQSTHINFMVEHGTPFRISLVDMTGRSTTVEEGISMGTQTQLALGNDLAPGTYIVKLKTPSSSSMTTIVKQ